MTEASPVSTSLPRSATGHAADVIPLALVLAEPSL